MQITPLAKYSAVAVLILPILGVIAWFGDRDMLPPTQASVNATHAESDQKRKVESDLARLSRLQLELRIALAEMHIESEKGDTPRYKQLEADLIALNKEIRELKKKLGL